MIMITLSLNILEKQLYRELPLGNKISHDTKKVIRFILKEKRISTKIQKNNLNNSKKHN